MAIPLRKLYRWSRAALILSLVVFAICLLIAIFAPPRHMGLYDTATYQARIALLALPLAAILCAISGGLLLYQRKASSKQPGLENQMQQIMRRLAPEERDYLQEKLDQQLAGLNEEGELVSLDDLLDQQADQ
jgi:type VI protein secretion system component VasK